MAVSVSTPVNTVSRDNLAVLVRNNAMNDSLEFHSDCDMMETDSPVGKPSASLQPISKKLFHSPMPQEREKQDYTLQGKLERSRKSRKRKLSRILGMDEEIKRAYVKECEIDSYSPEACGRMRKKVLISLFHNKEYSMDLCD